MKKLKKILLPILLLLSLTGGAYWWVSVVEVQRSTSSVQVDDARLRVWYNLVAPHYTDTTAANGNLGLDYIGALINTKTPSGFYFRDTTTGGHKWTLFATTSVSPIWGLITGTLSAQTDLQSALNAKQALISTGTTLEYFRGDLSRATFPTDLSSFTNGPAYLTTVSTTNSVTGAGTSGSQLKLVNDNASPGALKYYGTDNGATKGWNDISALIVNLYSANGRFNGDRYVNAGGHSFKMDSVYNPTFAIGRTNDPFTIVDSGGDATLTFERNGSSGAGFKQGFEISSWGVRNGGPNFSTSFADIIMDSGRTIIQNPYDYIFMLPASSGQPGITFSAQGGNYSFYNLVQQNDSGTWKPVVANSFGALSRMDGWPGGGGGGASDVVTTYSSGTTLTQGSGANYIQVNPASLQSTLTITTLASGGTWHTSNDLYIVFGGTITSGNPVITSFMFTAGSGLTVIETSAFSGAANAGDVAHYHKIGTLLYRVP